MTADALSTMADRIVRRFNPAGILLFGSHARGDAGRWSDVDLLVIMSDVSDRRQTAIAMQRLLGDIPVSKDIVVATSEEFDRKRHVVGTLFHAAYKDGRMLYERS